MIDLRPVVENDLLLIQTFRGLVPYAVTRIDSDEGFIYATANLYTGINSDIFSKYSDIKVSCSDAKVYLLKDGKQQSYYPLWGYAKVKYDNSEELGFVLVKGELYTAVQTVIKTTHFEKLSCKVIGLGLGDAPSVLFDLPKVGFAYFVETKLSKWDSDSEKVTYLGSKSGLQLVRNV